MTCSHSSGPTSTPPLPREAPWPRLSELPVENAAITLPVPEEKLFEVAADARAAFESAPPRRTEVAAEPEAEGQSKRAAAETRRPERATAAAKHGRGAKTRLARGASQSTHVAHAGRAASKHEINAGKPARRPVRVAALKKH